MVIVSGGAAGIDGIAHRAALDAGTPTIAVFGCGLGHCYPPEHKSLFEQILSSGGLIITEYPQDFNPTKYSFPARNRIISGISRGVLIMEAGERSGSLITLRLAKEQRKDLFVFPGSITGSAAAGSNKFLEQYPECTAISPNVITNKWGLDNVKSTAAAAQSSPILDALKKQPLHIEELMRITGMDCNALSSELTTLELSGAVNVLPGNIYSTG